MSPNTSPSAQPPPTCGIADVHLGADNLLSAFPVKAGIQSFQARACAKRARLNPAFAGDTVERADDKQHALTNT